MQEYSFVHLHNHTEFSFLDGAIRIKDLVKKAKEYKMPALAITDHGGMFGVIEFYNACMAEGIKPIIGFEAYVSPGSRFDKTRAEGVDPYSHLILLARDDEGYRNLIKLSSIGYIEGFYYKPRIDMEVIREHSKGIIATSACVAGAIPRAVLAGNMDEARRITREFVSIFGEGNFYIELQDHGIPDEKKAMKGVIEIARELGVPMIVANDAHYLRQEDAASHEVLLCIQTQTTLADPNRYKFNSDQIYFKSPEEMAKLFPDVPEAMSNTVAIAERCSVNPTSKAQLPVLKVPEGFANQEDYLRDLAVKGLHRMYEHVTPGLEERLNYELDVICRMGFAGYYLIVRDFVEAARRMGIAASTRGSASGSLVAHCVDISRTEPMRYDLLFERFLNPERISMPDIDLDFSDRDRYRVIDYVIKTYGRNSVCQIINFGRMKAKMAVKDAARVMGVLPADAQKLSNMVNEKSLKEALETNGDLIKLIDSNPTYKEVFRHARALEGLARQAGMHAGGVIVAPGDVRQWAPLFRQPSNDILMTQFDMKTVEQAGLIKMDFLGLKTLTVLQETERHIERRHGKHLSAWDLPEGDQKTYALLGRGETTGVFQFESQGMQDYLRKLKPTMIEDIIAMTALYRPGPMANIDVYIRRKHGKEPVNFLHELLESVLKVTQGVIIYQEQVMLIAQRMGGFTMGQADVLRKAMGKKQADKMEEMGKKFVDGAVKRGVPEAVAKEVYSYMAKFAEYGFCKGHAASYAHVSYQAAYFKAHYPVEYMAANISVYMKDQDDFFVLKSESERMGIKLLRPDINASETECSIEENCIRLGLGGIKNVGKAAEEIIKVRADHGPFKSIFDLCANVDTHALNKSALEALIYSGALDCLNGTRAQFVAAIDKALEYANRQQKERSLGQTSLFDIASGASPVAVIPEPSLPDVPAWPYTELLTKEKEVLNFYISGHPLDRFRDEVRGFTTTVLSVDRLRELKNQQKATLGGMVTSLRPYTDKKGKQMAFGVLEDFEGSIELVVFSDAYEKLRHLIAPDVMVLVAGTVDLRDAEGGGGKPKLIVDNAMPLSEARERLARSVHVRLNTQGLEQEFVSNLTETCRKYVGECALILHLITKENNDFRVLARQIKVNPNKDTITELRQAVGESNVWLSRAAA